MATYNNPGNLEKGQGYAGETGELYGNDRFSVFENPQMGTRALFKDLRTKLRRFKGDLPSMISQYAPPNENDTKKYINFVAKRIGKYEILEEDLPSVAKAVIEMENKEQERKVYLDNPRILEEGYNLSLLDLPNTARYEDALQEYSRIQAEKNTGWMIQRNPYPYSPRPI